MIPEPLDLQGPQVSQGSKVSVDLTVSLETWDLQVNLGRLVSRDPLVELECWVVQAHQEELVFLEVLGLSDPLAHQDPKEQQAHLVQVVRAKRMSIMCSMNEARKI